MKRSLSEFCSAMSGALIGADKPFSGVSIDSRTCAPGNLFFAIQGDRFDGHQFLAEAEIKGAAAVVVSTRCATDLPQILVEDTLVALQSAAASWRQSFSIPVVAVAGSNGKTTTKELISVILSEKGPCLWTKGTLNNHIGVPLTLLGLEAHHWAAVIEIGANHPGEVAALTRLVCPTVGLVTNAGAEHLEGFGSLEGVAKAEGELFAELSPSACAVMNADDRYFDLWTEMNQAQRRVTFGNRADADVRLEGDISASGTANQHQHFRALTPKGLVHASLALAGRHNVTNALAALAVGSELGCTAEQLAAGVSKMRPVKGRLTVKSAVTGGCVIDDSYNANPSSLEASLNVIATVPGERWLVLGNMGELGDSSAQAHRDAGALARRAEVSKLFLLGELAALAADTFGGQAEVFASVDDLSNRLQGRLRPGITVLIKGSRANRLERVVDALVLTERAGS